MVTAALDADLLIAEAKQHARRRRLLALGAVAVVAAAASGMLATRPSANSRGMCATPPPGFQVRTVTDATLAPPTVVLTNFRFGRMNDLFGLTDRFNWPPNGVTVAVSNLGRRHEPDLRSRSFRFTGADFGGIEGSTQPSGFMEVRSPSGVILDAYVEVGVLTPATIAAANQALSSVRTCSA